MAEIQQRPELDYDQMAEAQLVACAQDGQREAFRVIIQRSNQRLFRVARGIVSDDTEAEDVLQESYTKALTHIGSFRQEARLLTWLTRITINEARGRLRSRRIHVDLDHIEAAQEAGAQVLVFPGGQAMSDPEAEASRTQVRRVIEQAIDTLPETFRLVFILRDVQDCTVEETAAILNVRPETIKTRLHRARRLLRAELAGKLATTMREAFPFLGMRCAKITDVVLDRLASVYDWNE